MAAWVGSVNATKGPRIAPDGTVIWPKGRTVPREIRELSSEVLVTLGIPAAVECLVDDKATHQEKRAWTALLKDLGPGDALSVPRDAEGSDVQGVVMLPTMNPRPVRPPGLEAPELTTSTLPADSRALDLAADLGPLMAKRARGELTDDEEDDDE